MKIRLLICAALLVAFVSPSAKAEDNLTLDDYARTVVYLYQKNPVSETIGGKKYDLYYHDPATKNIFIAKTDEESGTGFLLFSESGLFLVTAAHVANLLNRDPHIVIRGKDGVPTDLALKELSLSGEMDWVFHPTADIAVLRFKPTPDARFNKHFLSVSMLRTDSDAPPLGQTLRILGFPLALGSRGKFSPIVKTVSVASKIMTLPRFDTSKPADFFLIDSPPAAGYSGAPLFAVSGWEVKDNGEASTVVTRYIAGLVHGEISDNTGGKIGAIVPANEIYETIKLAEQR